MGKSSPQASYLDILEPLLSGMDEMLLIVDPVGKILRANPAALSALGFDEAELVGADVMHLIPSERHAEAMEQVTGIKPGNMSESYIPLVSKAGRIIPVRSRLYKSMWGNREAYLVIIRDLSELAEAGTKFDRFLNEAPASITISPLETGRFTEVNDFFLKRLGYQRSEVIGRTPVELNMYVDPAARETIVKAIQTYGYIRDFEVEFRDKNGATHFGIFSGDVIQYQNRSCLLTIVTDNTEKRRLEREASETKAHLRAILDHLPDLAWLKDRESRFISVNKRFEEACGYRNEELVGKTDFDIWPMDLAVQYRRDDEDVMRAKASKIVEETVTDRKGGVWFETYKTPVFDPEGRVVGVTGITRDITGRKLLEQQLEQQKLFMKALLDAIPDRIFYKDRRSVFLGCNKAFAEFYGLEEERIVGKTDLALLGDPVMADFFRRKDQETLTSGRATITEETVTDKDGRNFDTETVKTPFYDAQGHAAGLIGIARDITRRRLDEHQLKQGKEFAEMLLGTVPSAVFSVDREHRITSWNRMAEIITGYSAQEMMGQPCSIFSEHQCGENCGLFDDGLAKPIIDGECVIRTKQGELRQITKNLEILRNEAGEVIGGIECFDDITEKIEMEKQLRESEQRYAAIVNSAPDFITIHRQGEILFVNAAALDKTGYAKEELLGHHVLEFLTEASQKRVKAAMEARELGDLVGEYEIELVTKYGTILNLIVKTTLITYDHERASLALLVDITNRKQMEEALRRAKEQTAGLE